MNIHTKLIFILLFISFQVEIFAAQLFSGWQNPNIGLTLDALTEVNNAKGRWLSSGVTIRSAELIVQGNIDPYASLMTNILISQEGAELHEAFAEFHSLPFNLKLKSGLMLANFGRWNQFHIHSMPFASEPRLYKEYIDGMLALKGAELYFLAPISHYLELSFGVYDLIVGHSHDFDPPDNSPNYTPEEVANIIGAIPHGSHYDYKGMHIYQIGDLYNIAGLPAPNDPEIYRGTRGPLDFAYGGRITTTFDISQENSLDLGMSLIYQSKWKVSKRQDYGFPHYYDKFLGGIDLVFFWHPLDKNQYRNLQWGLEVLVTKEYFEKIFPSIQLIESFRGGMFLWIDYQHNDNLHIGAFSNILQSNKTDAKTIKHQNGIYLSIPFTHYQYLRFEYSFFNYPQLLDKVSRIMIQYNATIGYHSHGRKR